VGEKSFLTNDERGVAREKKKVWQRSRWRSSSKIALDPLGDGSPLLRNRGCVDESKRSGSLTVARVEAMLDYPGG